MKTSPLIKVTRWTHEEFDQTLVLKGSMEATKQIAIDCLGRDQRAVDPVGKEGTMSKQDLDNLPEFEG